MSDEVVPNLVTQVNYQRPILAVPNSSNPHFLVSLRYHMWALADRQEAGPRSATHVQLLMCANPGPKRAPMLVEHGSSSNAG
eukprot:365593-Chlamydomonas_euryale.AAC.7